MSTLQSDERSKLLPAGAVPIPGMIRNNSNNFRREPGVGSLPYGSSLKGSWLSVQKNLSSLQQQRTHHHPQPSPSGPTLSPVSPTHFPPPAPPPSPLVLAASSPHTENGDDGDDDLNAVLFMNRAGSISMSAAQESFAAPSALKKRQSTISSSRATTIADNASEIDGGETDAARQDGADRKDEGYGDEEEKEHSPGIARWFKFAFLCFVMIGTVGSSGEGVQSMFSVMADRGVWASECADGNYPCDASHLRIASVIVIALSIMNVAGIFSGIVIDAVGVRIAAVVSAVVWAVSTGIAGIDPPSGLWWSAGFVLQQAANGAIFLCIFTGLLQSLFPQSKSAAEERLFAICSSIASGCWDLGAIGGSAYAKVLDFRGPQNNMSLGENYMIIGGALGLVPAILFRLLFEQPNKKLTIAGLKQQLRAMREITRHSFFWLLTALMTVVCQNGYAIIAFAGEILAWKKASAEEIKDMRPWVGNLISASCIFAVIPGLLMASPRLGLFGGVSVTCVLLSLLAAGMLAVIVAGDAFQQYVSFMIMSVWRTITFTLINAVLPMYLIVADGFYDTTANRGEADGEEPKPPLVMATGLAFGVMSLFGGVVSLVFGIVASHVFKGHAVSNATSMTTVAAPSSSSNGSQHHKAVVGDGVAAGWVFVTVMSVIWGMAIIVPIPLAVRCYQLQKVRDANRLEEKKRRDEQRHESSLGNE